MRVAPCAIRDPVRCETPQSGHRFRSGKRLQSESGWNLFADFRAPSLDSTRIIRVSETSIYSRYDRNNVSGLTRSARAIFPTISMVGFRVPRSIPEM